MSDSFLDTLACHLIKFTIRYSIDDASSMRALKSTFSYAGVDHGELFGMV